MADRKPLQVPDPSRQIRFHDLLVVARRTWLHEALSAALAIADPGEIKRQLAAYVPTDVQRSLAAAGIRDEHIFPTPHLLEMQPSLIGYYRLLLGVPQKTSYGSGTGMSIFRRMEIAGTINDRQRAALPEFCATMAIALAELVRKTAPALTPRDVTELPLLILGSQFQGGNNNSIGQAAIKGVFLSIVEITKDMLTSQTATELRLTTPSGRSFVIALASDPDVSVREVLPDNVKNRLSIEVKGGADRSNIYNRGESRKVPPNGTWGGICRMLDDHQYERRRYRQAQRRIANNR